MPRPSRRRASKKVDDLNDEMDEDAARRLQNAVTAVVDILRDR